MLFAEKYCYITNKEKKRCDGTALATPDVRKQTISETRNIEVVKT